MNIDSYDRKINYLRVSVTDRCNLRCRYCMPEEGIEDIGHTNILTLEEIARLVKIAASLGANKVRLTGGEPLVRKGIENLVKEISSLGSIRDIALTTNGVLFADMADELKTNGLNRVNFSLDSLDAAKFKYITGGGDLSRVLAAVEKALALQMMPVKINVVALKGFNDTEFLDFVKLAAEYPVHVRFIEFMPVGDLPFFTDERTISVKEVLEIIGSAYELTDILSVQGNGPARYYQTKGAAGTIGFIGAMSEYICRSCNRMRLTADGKLRGCLYASAETNVRSALKNGATDAQIADLFAKTVREKPRRHEMESGWGRENARKMSQIGG